MSNPPHPELLQLGYYISPKGGAPSPFLIREDLLFWELLTKGKVRHPETGEWAGEGTVFAHRPGQVTIHQAPHDVQYECMTVSFRISRAEMEALDLPRSYFWKDPVGVKTFTSEVLHAAHHEKMELQELGPYVWAQLLFRLARSRSELTEESMPEPVSQALHCMTREPGKDWSLEMLAGQIGWSTSHLHARFREYTGKTPHQFLIDQRMAEARHRLVRSRDPIKKIAYDVGFSNPENFCRMFKQVHGQTAKSFRLKHQLFPAEL